jgi:hypothetical protein
VASESKECGGEIQKNEHFEHFGPRSTRRGVHHRAQRRKEEKEGREKRRKNYKNASSRLIIPHCHRCGRMSTFLSKDLDQLTRKELQQALKQCDAVATGTNTALRARYSIEMAKQQQRTAAPYPDVKPAAAAAAKMSSSPAAVGKKTPPKKKVKAQKPEKRLKRYRGSCPISVQERIDRAKTQRLFLIKRGDVTAPPRLSCNFVVLGSTGNVYTVTIETLPNCSCPDHAKGNLCKHILFVLIKVMGLETQSPLIYQASWITTELEAMFEQMKVRFGQVSGAVLANDQVRATFAKLETGQDMSDDDDGVTGKKMDGVARRLFDDEEDCPICFDAMTEKDATTFCRQRCGANFHQECIRHWLQQKDQPKDQLCPMCRAPWEQEKQAASTKKTAEGFTNLGRIQGQSPDRDTSTYSSWFQSPSKRRRNW